MNGKSHNGALPSWRGRKRVVAAAIGVIGITLAASGATALNSGGQADVRQALSQSEPGSKIVEIPVPTDLDPIAKEALSDGVVSFEEYRAAIDRVIACANASGNAIASARPDPSGVLLEYSVPAAATIRFDSCYDRLGRPLDVAYQTQQSTVLGREAYFERVGACMKAVGLDYESLAGQFIAQGQLATTGNDQQRAFEDQASIKDKVEMSMAVIPPDSPEYDLAIQCVDS